MIVIRGLLPHGRKIDRELFYVTGKDSDYIDIEDLF